MQSKELSSSGGYASTTYNCWGRAHGMSTPCASACCLEPHERGRPPSEFRLAFRYDG